ncbi:integumentary mucin C.1-like isoform X2 [Eriocheir sinensis]|uniref:integumentary mucin C.1-like isoform X2 n=1 Tax=Eriocheir sinensis TaxID=95602 RepID=UPI0021C72F8A|nr:integumentary mucin C.1-like isoform X2 [Eriocheir sinensis]
MPHQRAPSGPRLVPFLLVALCTVALLPTLATATRTETIESNKYEMKTLTEPSMRICLALLEGGADFDAKLRLEIVPKSGADIMFLSGNADVTKELLQKVSGASQLRYEYTTADQKIALKVTLNGDELPYTSYQDISSAQYTFNLVKFYIRGHVEVTYDCPEVVATTPTTTTTTTTTITPTPTTPTTTTKDSNPAPPTTPRPNKTQGGKNSTLAQPAAAPSNPEEDQPGVSTAAGSMSTLLIVLVVVGLLVLVLVVSGVVLWRRKKRSMRPDQFHTAEVTPLDPPANVATIQGTNVGTESLYNSVYRPTTTANG